MQVKRMRIQPSYNSKSKIDLVGTSSKNHLRDGLVRLMHKFAKSVTETNSKVQKPKTYNEAINNLIYRNR